MGKWRNNVIKGAGHTQKSWYLVCPVPDQQSLCLFLFACVQQLVWDLWSQSVHGAAPGVSECLGASCQTGSMARVPATGETGVSQTKCQPLGRDQVIGAHVSVLPVTGAHAGVQVSA